MKHVCLPVAVVAPSQHRADCLQWRSDKAIRFRWSAADKDKPRTRMVIYGDRAASGGAPASSCLAGQKVQPHAPPYVQTDHIAYFLPRLPTIVCSFRVHLTNQAASLRTHFAGHGCRLGSANDQVGGGAQDHHRSFTCRPAPAPDTPTNTSKHQQTQANTNKHKQAPRH